MPFCLTSLLLCVCACVRVMCVVIVWACVYGHSSCRYVWSPTAKFAIAVSSIGAIICAPLHAAGYNLVEREMGACEVGSLMHALNFTGLVTGTTLPLCRRRGCGRLVCTQQLYESVGRGARPFYHSR